MPTTLEALTIPNLKRIALFTCANVKQAITFSTVSSIFREAMVDYKGLYDVYHSELASMTPDSIRTKFSGSYDSGEKPIDFFMTISRTINGKYSSLAWVLGEVLQHPNAPTIFSLYHFRRTAQITSLLYEMISGSNTAALTVIFDFLGDQVLQQKVPLPVSLLLKKQLQNPAETVREGSEDQIDPTIAADEIPPFALMSLVTQSKKIDSLKVLVNGLLKLGLLKDQLEKVHSAPNHRQLQFCNTNKTVMMFMYLLQPDPCFEFLFETSEREFGPEFVKNQLILRRSHDANDPKRLLQLICDFVEPHGLKSTIRWSLKYGILEQQIDEDQLGVQLACSQEPSFELFLTTIEKYFASVSSSSSSKEEQLLRQRDVLIKKMITQTNPHIPNHADSGRSVLSLLLFNQSVSSLVFSSLLLRMKRLGILRSIILHGKNSDNNHNILHEAAQAGSILKLQQILELIILDEDLGLGLDALKQLLTEQLPGSLETPLHLVTDLICFRGMLAACKDEQMAQDVLDNYQNKSGKSARQVKMEITTVKGFVKLFKQTKPSEMWKDAREITKKTNKTWKIV